MNSFNYFIDSYPINAILDLELFAVRDFLLQKYNINSIYLGYNKITSEIFSNENQNDPAKMLTGAKSIGHTSILGFDIDEMKQALMTFDEIYLCYCAIPVDEMDYLVENDSIEDWEVEELLSHTFKRNFVSIGSIPIENFERCRTFKFFYIL